MARPTYRLGSRRGCKCRDRVQDRYCPVYEAYSKELISEKKERKEPLQMAKQIRFTYDGVDYTLEFTRKSVETMERNGFVITEVFEKPMTLLPTLFAGAFLAHHRSVKREVIDKIYESMPNKQDLITKLAEMYNEPIAALLDEPEDEEGNVKWEATW